MFVTGSLAVELEFMAYLAEQEALLSDSTIEADKFLVFQYQFLKNHLSRWVDMVCEAILDTSTNPFYEAAGTLTVEFVHDESNIEKSET
jgi:TorA maturation chaperone TorD